MMIGLIVNPVAGMGGKVGLKGTDGVVEEARSRGAEEVSGIVAKKFIDSISCNPFFLVPDGKMGENILKDSKFEYEVIYHAKEPSSAEDTRKAARKISEKGAELIVFVGGDGTARDVSSSIDGKIPILGIPSGVKMYSSCFSLSPEAGAALLCEFLDGRCSLKDADILDIDEEAYRDGELSVRLYSHASVPYLKSLVQAGKQEYFEGGEEDAKEEIAEYFVENMEKDALYIISAGTTTAKIAEKMGVKKTVLGVDAYYNGKPVGMDLNEKGILKILREYKKAKIVVSPIGAQGFIFGRGNQQISASVIRKVGVKNIVVVATPQKLRETPVLYVYTGDEELDREFRGHIRVLIGYGRCRMVRVL